MTEIQRINEQQEWQKSLVELVNECSANFDITPPEIIKEELDSDESHQEFALKMKEVIIREWEIDRSNYFETKCIQIIIKIMWGYDWEIDGSWWDKTQEAFLSTFSESERSKLSVGWDWQLRTTYLDWIGHTVLENEYETINTWINIAQMLTLKLEEEWIDREYINQITDNSNLLLQIFPGLKLHLSNGDLKGALKYLRDEDKSIQDLDIPTDKKPIVEAMINAIEFASIIEDSEKMKALRIKQAVFIVLDSFEVINLDDSISYLDWEKELYDSFKRNIEKIFENKELSGEQIIDKLEEKSQKFHWKIKDWVNKKNPARHWWPIPDNYENIIRLNNNHIKRITERFNSFTRVLSSVNIEWTNEQIYTEAIKWFVDISTDNPITNPDLRFKSPSFLYSLKYKLTNTFSWEYEMVLWEIISKGNIDIEEKVSKNKEIIREKMPDISEEEIEIRARILTKLELEQELEYDIFKNLESKIKLWKITWEKKELIEQYKDLFDPTNEVFNLSINTKNILLEEVISIPLTAFVIWRISKFIFWIKQATFKWALWVDFLEWTSFELINRTRQSRGTFEWYTLKDFLAWSIAWAGLFSVMKHTYPFLNKMWVDSSKLSWKTINNSVELWAFTGIEFLSQNMFYGDNIFENWQAPENILSNLGLLFLVKLWYNPKELLLINNSSSVIRTKVGNKSTNTKSSNYPESEWGVNLEIKDVLSWNIENLMKWFWGLDSKIDSEFQSLISTNENILNLKLEAESLINDKIEQRITELEALWIRVNTIEDIKYVRNYKLQRMAEFNKLIEISESWGRIDEIQMSLWNINWILKIKDVEGVKKYLESIQNRTSINYTPGFKRQTNQE